jgi:lipoyl-dependent peroxiredoxin
MAVTSAASTSWTGDLASGSGRTTLETSQVGSYDVSWKARTEPGGGTTTPEELIAAAHASCFSMALANGLSENGTPPESIRTGSQVRFDPSTATITVIELTTTATVPGIDDAAFQQVAAATKDGCPVSKALAGVEISLTAALG